MLNNRCRHISNLRFFPHMRPVRIIGAIRIRIVPSLIHLAAMIFLETCFHNIDRCIDLLLRIHL